MTTATVNNNTNSIILTTGLYDLLKDYLRTHKLSKYNEEKLSQELRAAQQVLKRQLPPNVVTVNKKVRVKLLNTGDVLEFKFVGTANAKQKHNTTSIMSPIGIATIGHPEGALLNWELPEGVTPMRIEEVSDL